MNIELLLAVKQHILDHPLEFDMCSYVDISERSPCGTTACIAAEAVYLGDGITYRKLWEMERNDSYFTIEGRAIELLELDDVGEKLFHIAYWPQPFQDQYRMSVEVENYRTAAQIAANRIDHFIATGL